MSLTCRFYSYSAPQGSGAPQAAERRGRREVRDSKQGSKILMMSTLFIVCYAGHLFGPGIVTIMFNVQCLYHPDSST